MTLKQRIIRLIETNGPITVADYMSFCLGDSEAGYYITREPFGRDGDFITAPEVSQMFGELIGVWCVEAWQALGRPPRFVLAEMGPGRGTLMADLLRTVARLSPEFVAAAQTTLIETSPRLTEVQRQTLGPLPSEVTWITHFEDLANGPLIFVANELFDALSIHQYIKAGTQFAERMVGLNQTGDLCFAAGAGSIDQSLLPEGHQVAPEGTIFEISPARSALMEAIALRVAQQRGAALLIDYGHLQAGFGDTLQALRRHKPEDVLENPGDADLTSHVDFEALCRIAQNLSCRTGTMTQGDFLLNMGLLDRAGQLGRNRDKAFQQQLHIDVERLAGPDEMGQLFKVLCVTDPLTTIFPFAEA